MFHEPAEALNAACSPSHVFYCSYKRLPGRLDIIGVTGKPGTRERLGPPVALNVVRYLIFRGIFAQMWHLFLSRGTLIPVVSSFETRLSSLLGYCPYFNVYRNFFRLRRSSGGVIPRNLDTRLFEVREAFKRSWLLHGL